MENDALLNKLMDLVREDKRTGLRERIANTLNLIRGSGADGEHQAARFLQDLDVYVHLSGPQFMYSRGIAETLRVGEDIFELAYAVKKALR